MATIVGTAGDDTLIGTEFTDQIDGGEGNDYLEGGDALDGLEGGAGDDTLSGGNGNDFVFDQGGGNDVLYGGDGDDDMAGGAGDDLLIGGDGNDNMGGGTGSDTLLGGDGDDHLSIFAFQVGDGVFDGGDGVDTIDIAFISTAVVDLAAGFMQLTSRVGGTTTTSSLDGIENVFITGRSQALIIGNDSANVLVGGSSDDTLIGGLGNDTLAGDDGQDVFVFNVAPGEANADEISFNDASLGGPDRLALDNDVMAALGTAGDFSVDDERFHAAAGATGGAEADDRVVLDTDTGRLYYDADGSGSGEALLFATLAFPQVLLAENITVI
jgi:Ca2+-binding RTX toxin-like protein